MKLDAPFLLLAVTAVMLGTREWLRARRIAHSVLHRAAAAAFGGNAPLPASLVSLQVPALLAWARADNVPLAFVWFEMHAPDIKACTMALRAQMRRHESLYDFGAGGLLAVLWNCPPAHLGVACKRLFSAVPDSAWTLRVGGAVLDVDAQSVRGLLAAARRNLVTPWELDDPELHASFVDPEQRMPLPWWIRIQLAVELNAARIVPACIGVLAAFASVRLLPGGLNTFETACVSAVGGICLALLAAALIPLQTLPAWFGLALGLAAELASQTGPYASRTVLRVIVGVILGGWTARVIDRRDVFAPVVIAAGIGDAWSVYSRHGVTHYLAKQHGIALHASVPGPMHVVAAPFHLVLPLFWLGLVDMVLIATMLSWVVNWGLPFVRSALGLAGGIGAALFIVGSLPQGHLIPVIPFLATGFLLANPELLRDTWRLVTSRGAALGDVPGSEDRSLGSEGVAWP